MSTTVSQLLTYCELKTQAGTGNLNSATVGLKLLNEAMLDMRMEMIKRGIDASQTQESYVASVSPPSANNGSTFAYPSDMFALKSIEVNMTDSSAQNYVLATQVDVSNIPGQASFSWLRLNQPTLSPLFDDRGDTFEIFPSFSVATNTTNAIRIFYYLTPTEYASTSDTLTYPDSLNVYLLGTKICSLFYESLNKFADADNWNIKYNAGLNKLNTTLAQGSKQPLQPTGLTLTGYEF
jgi:hypothetical protein